MGGSSVRLLALILIGPVCCCQSNRDVDVSNLQAGIERKKFQTEMSGAEHHQFSALINGDEYRCYSVSFGYFPGTEYYFVFENEILISMMQSAQFFEWEETEHRSAQASWIAEERMQNILDANSFTVGEFKDDLNKELTRHADRKRNRKISNVWPLIPLLAIDSLRAQSRRKNWSKKYDPELVELSASGSIADSIYGDPVFVIPAAEFETRVYGPAQTLETFRGRLRLSPTMKRFFWVAVRIEDGRIVRVFSNNLFNQRVLAQDEFFIQQ